MSKPRAAHPTTHVPGGETSLVRTAVAIALAVVGIAWIVVTTTVAGDGTPAWLADLGLWSYLIGFGLFFLALALAAHPSTPLGRGRGVVVGMLGCFVLGLLWICTYYVAGGTYDIPVIADLSNYNLLVGIGFMATGFVFATRWE